MFNERIIAMERVKIFAKTVEDEAALQIEKMSKCDAYKDCTIRVMPDCHAGKGCTIGTVIELKDKVVPNTVGVDIGCGMLVACFGKIDVDLKKLDDVINEFVPSGFRIHEKPIEQMPDLLFMKAKEIIDIDNDYRSIGTLGGGNHFIEANVDKEGRFYIVIHSGSRNLGVRVCEYYQEKGIMAACIASSEKHDKKREELIKKLKEEGRQNDIKNELRKLVKPKIDGELASIDYKWIEDYMNDMVIAQRYAALNREVIMRTICTKMDINTFDMFQTVHNYIDNSMNRLIVRKGAVRAMEGEHLIIPMNMRDGSLICVGKGNPDWLYSAPHGAGRLMSRKKAFQTLDVEQFKSEMKGVYSTSVCPETLDESPMVYKPMQEIIDCMMPTVKVIDIIKPIYNFKAKETRKF